MKEIKKIISINHYYCNYKQYEHYVLYIYCDVF